MPQRMGKSTHSLRIVAQTRRCNEADNRHDVSVMGKKAVSLSDIARRLDTTAATISRALRNDPRISESMCRRARRVADELGYRPDPEAQRLMTRLRASREVRFVATLGLINDAEPGADFYRDPYTAQVVAGAEERAHELGYVLDEIRVRAPGIGAARLGGIFRSRSIRGVLVPPQAELRKDIPLPFGELSIVAATAARLELPLHRVSPDHFANLTLLVEKLLELGHRRIGLLTTEDMEMRQRRAPTAVFHWFAREQGSIAAIPPIDAVRQPARIGAWFKKHRPTAVLAPDAWALDLLAPFARVPEDVSLMLYGNRRPGIAGLDELPEAVGAAAIDLLTAGLLRGEAGLSAHPKRMLIAGRYMPGNTARSLL